MWCLWKIIGEMDFVELGDVIKREDLRSGLGFSTIVYFVKEKLRLTLNKGPRARSNEIKHFYLSRTLNWFQGL
jgi:hypothetical protein